MRDSLVDIEIRTEKDQMEVNLGCIVVSHTFYYSVLWLADDVQTLQTPLADSGHSL